MTRLIRVILHGDQIQTDGVGQPGKLQHALGVCSVRREESAELQLLAVVGHPSILPGRCAVPAPGAIRSSTGRIQAELSHDAERLGSASRAEGRARRGQSAICGPPGQMQRAGGLAERGAGEQLRE